MRPLKLLISLGAAVVIAAIGAGLALAGQSGGGAHVKLAKTSDGIMPKP